MPGNLRNYSEASVAGRLEWNTILGSVFGPKFKKLSKNPHAVGSALGSLARIFHAVASAEEGIPHHFRDGYGHYNDASYEKGLVVNILYQFPELASFKGHMEEAVRQNLSETFTNYEASMTALELAYTCRMCRKDPLLQGYCCVMIIGIIANIARTMSSATLPIMIFPSRLGAEALYAQQVVIWERVANDAYTNKEVTEFDPAFRAVKTSHIP